MITEDCISFETAKLLKKKGFDCNANCYYIENSVTKTLFYSPIRENHNASCIENDAHINVSSGKMSAPTIQMAMKWLRKNHNLAISTSVTVEGWRSYVSQIKLDSEGFVVDIIDGIDNGNIPNCNTYEQSCEAAIKYCLENLI